MMIDFVADNISTPIFNKDSLVFRDIYYEIYIGGFHITGNGMYFRYYSFFLKNFLINNFDIGGVINDAPGFQVEVIHP